MAAKLLQEAHRFRPLWASLSPVYIYVSEKVTRETFPRILAWSKAYKGSGDASGVHLFDICHAEAEFVDERSQGFEILKVNINYAQFW